MKDRLLTAVGWACATFAVFAIGFWAYGRLMGWGPQ